MDTIIRCIVFPYLFIGIVFAIVGFLVMHQDERPVLNQFSILKILWVLFKVTLTWPRVAWDMIKLYRHRKEINKALDKYEKRRK